MMMQRQNGGTEPDMDASYTQPVKSMYGIVHYKRGVFTYEVGICTANIPGVKRASRTHLALQLQPKPFLVEELRVGIPVQVNKWIRASTDRLEATPVTMPTQERYERDGYKGTRLDGLEQRWELEFKQSRDTSGSTSVLDDCPRSIAT